MFEEQHDLFDDFQPEFESNDYDDIYEVGDVGYRHVITEEDERGVIITLLDTFGDPTEHYFSIEDFNKFSIAISDLSQELNELNDESEI